MQESRHAYASPRHCGKYNAIEAIEMKVSAFCIPPTRFDKRAGGVEMGSSRI